MRAPDPPLVILTDRSAWIEFLRNTGSPTCDRADVLLEEEFAVCDAIRMKVLAGACDERHQQALRRLLALATVLPTEPVGHDDATSRSGPSCGTGNSDMRCDSVW